MGLRQLTLPILCLLVPAQIIFYIWLLFSEVNKRNTYLLVFGFAGLMLFFYSYVFTWFPKAVSNGIDVFAIIPLMSSLLLFWGLFFSVIIFPIIFYIVYEKRHRVQDNNQNSQELRWSQYLKSINVYLIGLICWLGVLVYSLIFKISWLQDNNIAVLISGTFFCICLALLVRDRIKNHYDSYHSLFILLDVLVLILIFFSF